MLLIKINKMERDNNLPGRQSRSETRRGFRARAGEAVRRVIGRSEPNLNAAESALPPPTYEELFLPTYQEAVGNIGRAFINPDLPLVPLPQDFVPPSYETTVFSLQNESPLVTPSFELYRQPTGEETEAMRLENENFLRALRGEPPETAEQRATRGFEERIARKR
jgi:hypothetical protein